MSDRTHGFDQILTGGFLEDVAGGPSFQGTEEVGVALVHGQNQDLGMRAFRPDQAGSLQSIQVRHGDVQHGDIGATLSSQRHGLAAIRRFTHHLDVALGVQQQVQPFPHDVMILSQ